MLVAPGATSVSVDVFFADDTGAAVTGKVASDFPVCKWSGGSNTADTTITITDLAAITTAHPNDNTAGGVKEREGGWYRLDLPNNMLTSAGRKTLTFAETTNKRIIAPTFDVQYTQADLQTIKTQTVTCAAGVTILASVGTAATSTAQTGDSYVVVNDSTFGNAKLVRSTTPANTLTVDAAHKVAVTLAASDVTGNVSALLADGVAHGGFTASLVLSQLVIVNPVGNAITVQATGGDGIHIAATGGQDINLAGSQEILGNLNGFTSAALSQLLGADISSSIEGSAAIHSLASLILKLTSKFDSLTGKTYRTNGVTVHMTQAVTTSAVAVPITKIDVGV